MNLRILWMGLAASCGLLVATAKAQYVIPAAPVVYHAPVPVVTGYAPATLAYSPVVPAAPMVTHRPALAPAPLVTYRTYSPAVTTYSPLVATSSPAVTAYSPVVSTYSPVVTAYSPVVTAYSPVVSTYGPVVAYRPAVYGSSVWGSPQLYVPGQPVRNALRAVTP